MVEPQDVEQCVMMDVERGSGGSVRPRRPVEKTFRRYDQDQPMLLAPDLRDWLPGDHPARWVDDLVELWSGPDGVLRRLHRCSWGSAV